MVSLLSKNPQSLSLLAIQFSETDPKRFALRFPSVAPFASPRDAAYTERPVPQQRRSRIFFENVARLKIVK
jgi:hypothetical protein